MLCTACPQCGGNLSSIQLPLSSPPPPEFACLPEHFVEDIADVLLYVSRYAPQLLAAARMDELMLFLVVFMGRWVPPHHGEGLSQDDPLPAARMTTPSPICSSSPLSSLTCPPPPSPAPPMSRAAILGPKCQKCCMPGCHR